MEMAAEVRAIVRDACVRAVSVTSRWVERKNDATGGVGRSDVEEAKDGVESGAQRAQSE